MLVPVFEFLVLNIMPMLQQNNFCCNCNYNCNCASQILTHEKVFVLYKGSESQLYSIYWTRPGVFTGTSEFNLNYKYTLSKVNFQICIKKKRFSLYFVLRLLFI